MPRNDTQVVYEEPVDPRPVHVTVKFPENLALSLREIATERDMSKSAVLRNAFRFWLAEQAERRSA